MGYCESWGVAIHEVDVFDVIFRSMEMISKFQHHGKGVISAAR